MLLNTPLRPLVVVIALMVLVPIAMVAAAELSTPHKCGYQYQATYRNITRTGVTLLHEDRDTGAVMYEGVARDSTGPFESMRIGVFFDDIDDPTKYCTSASGKAPDFQGGELACTLDDVLTEEKKNILKTKLVPEALQLHVDRLLVNRLGNPIVLSDVLDSACNNFAIPASHRLGGVSGYDLIMYVAAGPTSGNTVAWATTCLHLSPPVEYTSSIGRPIFAAMNVCPKYISTTHSTVRVVAHEVAHALGFSKLFFDVASVYKTATVRQKKKSPIMRSSSILKAAREQYNCDSLANMELEDGIPTDTKTIHWKRRSAKDELMAASVTHGYYTALSIAAMEDLGYYRGDYSNAETMSWGLYVGCGPFEYVCLGSSYTPFTSMFCTNEDYVCTSDRDAVGYCYTTTKVSLPSWASSYGLYNDDATMDYCPYLKPYGNGNCADGEQSLAPDSKFGANSRCLDVSSGTAVCAAIVCTESTYTVQFKSGKPLTCTPGKSVTIPKGNRNVTCPLYYEVCDGPTKNAATIKTAVGCSGVLLVLLGLLASALMS